ncbi:MAG: alkaline phosphatase family protein [Betaproteobacteria bacterium]|nr:MAG: alkaline phosphatase family protein [Betaproteobacteria bacterium]
MRGIVMALALLGVPMADGIAANVQAAPSVRLVLQITIDGLRADLLNRYESGFGEGGFRYLLDEGIVYTNAHYQHANTETIVGHTTLATGTYPSTHGMVGNVWFDREAGELAYNIEDADAPLLATREETIEGEQVDPAQKRARTKGRSPRVILAPTLADTLSAYYAGRSKVFGVSGKDRSAVSMAGHTGKAFWFSTDNGDFVTSKYYYEAYPDWVRRWNGQRQAEKYAGTEWRLSSPLDTYLLAEQDDRPYEMDLKGFGRTFPHRFGEVGDKLLHTQVLVSPAGDQLLLDFSKALIVNEQLGRDSVPDYLSVSFSSVDAVNHFFGPSSLENEEVVRRLDRTLADLIKFIDKRVGLDNTLIVLSADHGMADMPEYMNSLGYDAGRLVPAEIVAAANEAGRQLGIEEVVRFFYRPYMYLNEEQIAAANLEHAQVAQTIARALTDMKGVELAVATGNPEMHQRSSLHNQVRRNQHVTRSGDIYVIQQPYWFLFDEGPIPAMHGSPWRYDTHVPIIFYGPGIGSRTVRRLVHPADVAPTVTALLGMTGPASATGTVLVEVIE